MERRNARLFIIDGGKKPALVVHGALPIDDNAREKAAAVARQEHNEKALRSPSWQSYIAKTRTLNANEPTPIEYGARLRELKKEK